MEVLIDGSWIELADGLSLEVLERSDGQLTSSQLSEELVEESEGTVEASEVETRLRELYQKRLIGMERASPN